MAWLMRIEARLPPGYHAGVLKEIAALHYRYRFDPAGLTTMERETLKARSLACLKVVIPDS